MAAKKSTAPTLFDMTEELQALMEDMEMFAEDNDGDLTDYPMDRFEKLEGEVKDKALKCARLYKEWKARGAAIKDEEKALAARRKAHEGRGDRLKAYLESCLPPNAKFEDALSSISWKKNPPSVEVLAPIESMPEKFLKRPPPEIKLAELKECMQEFEVPDTDVLGNPLFDTDGKALVHVEMQVRWPKPVQDPEPVEAGEDDVPFQEVKETPEVLPDVDPNNLDKVFILARLKQGKSLLIK